MADESNSLSQDSAEPLWRPAWLPALALVVATLVAYSSSLNGALVWDDDSWTSSVESLLQDFSGLCQMWDTSTALQQYYPLSGTTFWLDHHLWGGWTLPYHLENVLLHAGSALLLWTLLRRLKAPGAWLAAAIFALHPIMVESVGWITERKNVLSLFFFLWSLLVYGRFTGYWETDSSPRGRLGTYAFALALFLCALLAKITAFALPPVILLLCWWKRGRIRAWQDVLPTVPFFALAVGLGCLVGWLEENHVGAQGAGFDLSFPERFLIAGRAFWFYPFQLLWPANLCFVYPRWQVNPSDVLPWLFPVSALALLFVAWFLRGRIGRGVATALFFYVGTLFPVLGFLNAYGMRYAYVWDHWVYLSSLGIIALVAAGIVQLALRLGKPAVVTVCAAVMLPILALLTWRQGRMYKDIVTLWQTTIVKNPVCWMAYNNLGVALHVQSRLDEAVQSYRKSLEIFSGNAEAYNNLGVALEAQGKLDEAISAYQAAIKIYPDLDTAHRHYASALMKQGHGGQALLQLFYREASVLPGQHKWGGLVKLAWTLASSPDPLMRDGKLAVQLAEQANQISAGNPEVLQVLAAAYAEAGNFPEAVKITQQALPLASRDHDRDLSEALADQLKLYQAGQPFHEGGGKRPPANAPLPPAPR